MVDGDRDYESLMELFKISCFRAFCTKFSVNAIHPYRLMKRLNELHWIMYREQMKGNPRRTEEDTFCLTETRNGNVSMGKRKCTSADTMHC